MTTPHRKTSRLFAAVAAAPLLFVLACSEPPTASTSETATTIAAPVVEMGSFARSEMLRINAANFLQPIAETAENAAPPNGELTEVAAAAPAPEVRYNAAMVRLQVLLDRAHFSPGVIDGYNGENVRKAISAYQQAHGLDVDGEASDDLIATLARNDTAPALISYVITAEDAAGPFVDVPRDLQAMSELERVGYSSAEEALAEKFHMDVDMLRTLNPDTDFTRAGTEIVVANAGGELEAMVAEIEIDKAARALRAFDGQGNLIAFYPASIGSTEAPAPSGSYEVESVAFDPTYHYNAERLPTFGQRPHGDLDIAAGPNNPVGAVWIDLSLDTYGIHGAPEPSQVGKTASHGCVRLTNWDAQELGRAVRAGVPVDFIERSADSRMNVARPG